VQQQGRPRQIQRRPIDDSHTLAAEARRAFQQAERQLQAALLLAAKKHKVPLKILKGLVRVEQRDRSAIGDLWGKFRRKRTVSLGPGQIQVRRAGELIFPGRDFGKKPLTDTEFDSIAAKLENPVSHADLLAREMLDNYNFYGRSPGKSVADRWRFAIARHKGGHGPVGTAQVTAQGKKENHNSWAVVSKYIPAQIVKFVNEVYGTP